jgi:hypothetical protein
LVDGLGNIRSGALADWDRCRGSDIDRRIVLRLGPPQFAASFIDHLSSPGCTDLYGVIALHHNALKSSGTSPNFLITLASLKSPLSGAVR